VGIMSQQPGLHQAGDIPGVRVGDGQRLRPVNEIDFRLVGPGDSGFIKWPGQIEDVQRRDAGRRLFDWRQFKPGSGDKYAWRQRVLKLKMEQNAPGVAVVAVKIKGLVTAMHGRRLGRVNPGILVSINNKTTLAYRRGNIRYRNLQVIEQGRLPRG
jgi:hypothetical protein